MCIRDSCFWGWVVLIFHLPLPAGRFIRCFDRTCAAWNIVGKWFDFLFEFRAVKCSSWYHRHFAKVQLKIEDHNITILLTFLDGNCKTFTTFVDQYLLECLTVSLLCCDWSIECGRRSDWLPLSPADLPDNRLLPWTFKLCFHHLDPCLAPRISAWGVTSDD